MTPELSNVLAQLAQKLGTSAEALWPAMVARAKFSAGLDILATLLFMVAGLVALVWVLRRMTKEGYDMLDDGLGPLAPIAGILAFICVVATACEIPSRVVDYRYPEVAALRQIMGR